MPITETRHPEGATLFQNGYIGPHPSGIMRMKKRVIVSAVAVVAGLYVVGSFAGGAVAMRIPRLPLFSSPAAVGLAYADVSFPARDGTLLQGWYVPAKGDRVVIVVHGGIQNRVDEVVDTGGSSGTQSLSLKIDGVLVETREVTVALRSSTTVEFI
jgi:hypothetical protein